MINFTIPEVDGGKIYWFSFNCCRKNNPENLENGIFSCFPPRDTDSVCLTSFPIMYRKHTENFKPVWNGNCFLLSTILEVNSC